MFTSPWYMKFSTASTSSYLMPFRYRRGWLCGFLLRTALKKGEQAERMTLWASSWFPSQANVTSKKSLSSLSSLKAVLTLLSNSFHLRQNFSPPPELPPADIFDSEIWSCFPVKFLPPSHLVGWHWVRYQVYDLVLLKVIKDLRISGDLSRREEQLNYRLEGGGRSGKVVGFGLRTAASPRPSMYFINLKAFTLLSNTSTKIKSCVCGWPLGLTALNLFAVRQAGYPPSSPLRNCLYWKKSLRIWGVPHLPPFTVGFHKKVFDHLIYSF